MIAMGIAASAAAFLTACSTQGQEFSSATPPAVNVTSSANQDLDSHHQYEAIPIQCDDQGNGIAQKSKVLDQLPSDLGNERSKKLADGTVVTYVNSLPNADEMSRNFFLEQLHCAKGRFSVSLILNLNKQQTIPEEPIVIGKPVDHGKVELGDDQIRLVYNTDNPKHFPGGHHVNYVVTETDLLYNRSER